MDNRVALVGTAKGLVVFDFAGGGEPRLTDIHFAGYAANMVFADRRSGRWWVGLSHRHWGQKLHYSDDSGKSWQEAALPKLNGLTLPNGQPATLRQVWSMAGAGEDKQNELWLGTDPGALFHTKNNGASFELVKSLWHHPSREQEGQWFGAGSDYPFIHSVVVDPRDSQHVYVAVSCAGVFETTDGGENWHPRNKGLRAAYLPNPNVEVGHDPHVLLMSPQDSRILWQQNHCGIYTSTDGGGEWVECSDESGMPSYGFGMVIDEADPSRAWVIPVESDAQRIAPNLKLQVYRTDDFGKHWVSDSDGLPTGVSFDIVLRQAFRKEGDLFLFGTSNGNLFYRNGADTPWRSLHVHLTKVSSIFIC